jgi:hypothetical protein
MEYNDTYIALDTMVRQGWLFKRFSEFEKLLEALEKKNLITAAEHRALIELAKKMALDQLEH